jgi:hypothetical protein
MLEKNSISLFDLVKLSLRVFKTKPMRTFLTILGMSVGISTVVFLVSFGYGLQYILIGKLIATEDSLVTLTASYPSESKLGINIQKIEEIKSIPNVAETSAVAEYSGELRVESFAGLIPVVRIVEPNIFRLSGTNPDIGSSIRPNQNDVILSSQALTLLGLKTSRDVLGKTAQVKIYYPNEDGTVQDSVIEKDLNIVGIISDEQEPPLVIIPSHLAPVAPTIFKEIFVKAKKADVLIGLRDILEKQGFIISARIDLVTQARKITNIITKHLLFWYRSSYCFSY